MLHISLNRIELIFSNKHIISFMSKGNVHPEFIRNRTNIVFMIRECFKRLSSYVISNKNVQREQVQLEHVQFRHVTLGYVPLGRGLVTWARVVIWDRINSGNIINASKYHIKSM